MSHPTPAARLLDRAIAWYQVRRCVAERGVSRSVLPAAVRLLACCQAVALLTPQQRVQGVCCCGPVPIPFGFGRR